MSKTWKCLLIICAPLLLATLFAFTHTYDTVTPAGTDDPREADDRMREIKAALQERLDIAHFFELTGTEVSDSKTGYGRFPLNAKAFGAVGDGVTDDSSAFTTMEALDGDERIYLPDGTYIVNSVTLSKYYCGPGIITLDGIDRPRRVELYPSMVTLLKLSGDGSWILCDRNGNEIDISASTSDGLQEAFDLMVSQSANLWVNGSSKGPGSTEDYGIINCTETVTMLLLEQRTVRIDSVRLVFSAVLGSDPGLVVDSTMTSTVEFNGEIIYNGTGSALKFAPSDLSYFIAVPKGTGPVCTQSFFRFNLVNTRGDHCVEFDTSAGAIGNCYFEFCELNATHGTNYYITATGSSGKTFAANTISAKSMHGLSAIDPANAYVYITGGNYTISNKWSFNMDVAAGGTAVQTNEAFGQFYIDAIPQGAGAVGIQFDAAAKECDVWVKRLSDGAGTAVIDNSTAQNNTVYYKGNILLGNGSRIDGTILLSATTVSFAANAHTTLFTVPTGKRCILSHAIVVAGENAGATTKLTIGQNGAETDFVPACTLSNLDAQYDAVTLQPIFNATPVKNKSYAAATVIEAAVTNQSGGATNTIYLYGTLY